MVDCDAVFNLELPSDAAGYAHRAGRTARAGRCVCIRMELRAMPWGSAACSAMRAHSMSRQQACVTMWPILMYGAQLDREGTVVSLVTSGEAFVVEKMARKLQVDIPEVDVAGGSIKLCA